MQRYPAPIIKSNSRPLGGGVSGGIKLARSATLRMCISQQVSDIAGLGCTLHHFASFMESGQDPEFIDNIGALLLSQIAPWHNTLLTRAACRDGIRFVALNFYWEHRDAIQLRLLTASLVDEIATAYHATAGQSDDYLRGRCEQIKARLDSIRQRYPSREPLPRGSTFSRNLPRGYCLWDASRFELPTTLREFVLFGCRAVIG
jgi:hypothetical protein